MSSGLRDFRVSNNFTQVEIAKKIEVTPTYYSKIELGLRSPSYNFLIKFKKAFRNSDIDEIFFNNELHKMCISC